MRTLTQLQAAYADPAADRMQVIRELEWVEAKEKWRWLTTILQDRAGDYLERIEVLRILEVASIPADYVEELATVIQAIIRQDDDEEVRNYAVVALKNFAGIGSVAALAKEILLSGSEDIDVRWNALEVLRKLRRGPEVDAVVKALSEDAVFGKAVSRLAHGAQH